MGRGIKLLIWLALFFVLSTSLVILAVLPDLVTNSLINSPVEFSATYQPEEFGAIAEPLLLKTEDGLKLQAWEVAQENPKAVLIFLGGMLEPSVTAFWGHAAALHRSGYASLLVEMRAHGESEGNRIGLGYLEHLDILAALDFLQAKEVYQQVPVVVFGVDLGGVAAINGTGLYPEIAGLISIGAFSSWADLFADNLYFSGSPLIISLLERPFVRLYTVRKFGFANRKIFPLEQIANLGTRPALLMHGADDEQVAPLSLERLQMRAPKQAEFWLREGAGHLVAKDFLRPENDQEYFRRILNFLETNFGT